MTLNEWKKDLFTIPNLLSLFRLVLIPVYVTIYLNATESKDYYIAAGILAVSCLTDLIDGKIARRFNMISNTGRILDPLADKCTQFSLIVCLCFKYPLLWILAAFFFVKEIFQLAAGYLLLRKGKILSGALMAGKISTTVLFISLTLMILVPEMDETAAYIIAAINGVFLLISFISYIRLYITNSPMIQELTPEHPDDETK